MYYISPRFSLHFAIKSSASLCSSNRALSLKLERRRGRVRGFGIRCSLSSSRHLYGQSKFHVAFVYKTWNFTNKNRLITEEDENLCKRKTRKRWQGKRCKQNIVRRKGVNKVQTSIGLCGRAPSPRLPSSSSSSSTSSPSCS